MNISSTLLIRRLLVLWLVTSILGYGMALASDIHGDLFTELVHSIDSHAPNSDVEVGHDHCCHGVIHLLGLSNTIKNNSIIDKSFSLTPYALSVVSFIPPLLNRPPINT